MKREPVTDFDYLVSLGHARGDVKEALQLAKGDRNAALYILVRGGVKQQKAWRKESPEDWMNGTTVLPNIPENRALHISPVYIFVGQSWPTDDGKDYFFNLKVTLKDGREWTVKKTYSDFVALNMSLPLGTTVSFKNSFPLPPLASYFFGELTRAQWTERQNALQEWIRELCTDESSMTSDRVLDAVYSFVEAQSHGGRSGLKLKVTSPTSPSVVRNEPAISSPLLRDMHTGAGDRQLQRKQSYVDRATPLSVDLLPLPLTLVNELAPFKVNIRQLKCWTELQDMKATQMIRRLLEAADQFGVAESAEEADGGLTEVDVKQLHKDCRRDRFVIQGRRLEGSLVSAETVVQHCTASICEVITASGRNINLDAKVAGVGAGAGAGNPFDDEEPPTALPVLQSSASEATATATTSTATELAVATTITETAPSACSVPVSGVKATAGTVCRPPRNPFEDGDESSQQTTASHQGGTICRPPASASALVTAAAAAAAAPAMAVTPIRRSSSAKNPFDDPDEGTVCAPPVGKGLDAFNTSRQPVDVKPTICAPPAGKVHQQEQLPSARQVTSEEEHWEGEDGSDTWRTVEAIDTRDEDRPSPPTVRESCDALSLHILHLVSRTESAYISHASLHDILDMTNQHGVPDFQPYLFVPESTLAEPICLHFSILERSSSTESAATAAGNRRGNKSSAGEGAAEEWCVECRGEASTVYRLLDAMTMELIVQLRVTFLCTLYGMPTVSTGRTGQGGEVTALRLKEGKCHVVVDRVTTTTSRDWGKQSEV